MQIRQRLPQYISLMRLDKPIGIFLLLWPTLWAIWLASHGHPDVKILFVFIFGVILMRSAGCIMNDLADRYVDRCVERTRFRPLATGSVKVREAKLLALGLLLSAFCLVLLCNIYTIMLAFMGAFLAAIYPFLKRITHLPQLGLGLAFSWGVPMAFAAQTGKVGLAGWYLFLTGVIWPMIYDTMYAMVDKEDDIKIGVKSTAILFNAMDKMIIALLQCLFMVMLVIVGLMFHLHPIYYLSIVMTLVLFIYQQYLLHMQSKEKYLLAFFNNNWVGFAIFIGILLSYQ